MIPRKILSAVLSAALAAAAVPYNFSAKAADDKLPVNADEYAKLSSVEEAGGFLRNCLQSGKSSTLIRYPRKLWNDDIFYQVVAEALKETSSGFNGDYWRYFYDSMGYNCLYNGDYVYLDMNLTLSSSHEHDIELIKRCNYLKSKINSEIINLKNTTPTADIDFEKIKIIYNYIKDNVKLYESPTTVYDTLYDTLYDTAYAAAVKGTATPKGIAQLFYVFAKEEGFDCRIIKGELNENSGGYVNNYWNIVGINGKYYYVDAALDMMIGTNSTYYFLNGEDDIDNIYKDVQHYYSSYNNFCGEALKVNYLSKEFKAAYPISDTRYPAVAFEYGDVNSDGKVNAVDASAVLRYYAETSAGRTGSITDSLRIAADVTRNGHIDAVDASNILSYYAVSSAKNVGTITEYLSSRK